VGGGDGRALSGGAARHKGGHGSVGTGIKCGLENLRISEGGRGGGEGRWGALFGGIMEPA